MDRWAGCGLCDQAGRMRFRDWLRVLANKLAGVVLALGLGYYLGSRGWRPW